MNRYIRRGTGRVFWALELCDPANPNLCELDAAYDLTCDLTNEINGLDPIHTAVERQHVWSAHDSTMVGVAPGQTPVLTLLDCDENDLFNRTLFSEGSEGYLILAPYGLDKATARIEVGDRVDVLECQSAGWADSWSFGLQPATVRVRLAVTSETFRGIIADGSRPTFSTTPAGVVVQTTTQEGVVVHRLLDGSVWTGDISLNETLEDNGIDLFYHAPDGTVVAGVLNELTGARTLTLVDGAPYFGDPEALRLVNLVGTDTSYYADPTGLVVKRKTDPITRQVVYVLLDGTEYTGDTSLLIALEARDAI